MKVKRLSWVLAALLVASMSVPAAGEGSFHFASERLGFSLTVPGLSKGEIAAEESETGVDLFHAPSRERWGGLIGSIEVVSPRSRFLSEGNPNPAYRVLAMGKDRIFLWKSPGGGVNTGGDQLAAFTAAAGALCVENLRICLSVAEPDDQPALNPARRLAYLPAEGGLARPDAPLSRGELAEMLYALLSAENKGGPCAEPFSDTAGKPCAQAANYLAGYGILSGYGDGTFRPEQAVSRAAFAVVLHRCQFAAPVGRYGDAPGFSDVPDGHWAEEFIDSAGVLGWMAGDAGGRFQPDRAVTRAEAATAVNRMLGRDESHTAVESAANPFSDLDRGHWAYENILEAAGALPSPEPPAPKGGALPKGTGACHFRSEAEGWAVSGAQLRHTEDGGKTWAGLGRPFPFSVSGIFFFNSREGVLLGSGGGAPCILLRTADGGETWSDFLAEPGALERHFPAGQFATDKNLLSSIVSAELRPAGGDAVYLTVRYRPYESIYGMDLEAVRQTAITAEEIGGRDA